MRIAVNTRMLLKDKLEGIGYYTHELLRRLVILHPEHQFYFFFDRRFDDEFLYAENVTPVVLYPSARHPLLWYLWFEFSVKRALNKYQIDLFFSPDGHLCLNTKVPTILTIHDLAYKHFPKMIPWSARIYYKYFLPRFSKKAMKVITVSNFVKSEITSNFVKPASNVITIYNAATEGYKPLSIESILKVRNEYSNGRPYFFYVGAIHPRKNILKLIQGYEDFRDHSSADFPLLLAGRMAWQTSELEKYHRQSKYKEDIKFLGRVEQTALWGLMGAAHTFCYISKMEGFGIPIVEAMECHIPIICSDKGSLPEVCGEAGIIVNPDDTKSISFAMKTLYSDKHTYDLLKARSEKRKSKYSWEIAARQLSEVLFL